MLTDAAVAGWAYCVAFAHVTESSRQQLRRIGAERWRMRAKARAWCVRQRSGGCWCAGTASCACASPCGACSC